MNPFGLTVTAVRGELPVGGIIPAAQLNAYIDAEAVLKRNRARAAALLIAARRRRDDARRRAEAIVASAIEEGQRLAEACAREAHDRTCASVVQWLVDERELEAMVARRVETRCRQWVAEALACLSADVDRAAVIARRVEAAMRALASHGAITLRVSAADYDAVTTRMAQQDGFDVETDPVLESGQAVLDTPYVHLRFDVDRHLDQLLHAITGVTHAPAEPAERTADLSA